MHVRVRRYRIHRMFVVDDEGRLAGIVTLSDIMMCLSLHASAAELHLK